MTVSDNSLGDLRNRKLIAAVVAVSAVAALSACGSSTDTKVAAKVARPASLAAPTTSLPKATPGGVIDGRALAAIAVSAMVASKTAHITMASEGQQIGEGDIEFANPVKLAMKKRLQSENIEIVVVGGVAYMKGIPGTTKPWFIVRFDPQAGPSMEDVFNGADPRAAFLMMEGVSGKDMGTRRVSGVLTRQFAFVIPISTFGKAFGPEVRKRIEAAAKTPVAMESSVGDDNLLRKLTTVMVISSQKVSTEVTYSDWGKPVSIAAPPAGQVGPHPGT